MKGTLLTYYCMESNCDWEMTTHKSLDGIRCLACLGMVNVKPGKIDGDVKPPKPPAGRRKKSAGSISYKIDMESGKMQRQLRAIAKHTEALANELRGIDEEVCPECGSDEVEVARAYDGTGTQQEIAITECYSCGYPNHD